MCRNAVRLVLMLLAVSAGLMPAYSRAIPPNPCFLDYQVCVDCAPDLQAKCDHYTCDDGTERLSCAQCSIFVCIAN